MNFQRDVRTVLDLYYDIQDLIYKLDNITEQIKITCLNQPRLQGSLVQHPGAYMITLGAPLAGKVPSSIINIDVETILKYMITTKPGNKPKAVPRETLVIIEITKAIKDFFKMYVLPLREHLSDLKKSGVELIPAYLLDLLIDTESLPLYVTSKLVEVNINSRVKFGIRSSRLELENMWWEILRLTRPNRTFTIYHTALFFRAEECDHHLEYQLSNSPRLVTFCEKAELFSTTQSNPLSFFHTLQSTVIPHYFSVTHPKALYNYFLHAYLMTVRNIDTLEKGEVLSAPRIVEVPCSAHMKSEDWFKCLYGSGNVRRPDRSITDIQRYKKDVDLWFDTNIETLVSDDSIAELQNRQYYNDVNWICDRMIWITPSMRNDFLAVPLILVDAPPTPAKQILQAQDSLELGTRILLRMSGYNRKAVVNFPLNFQFKMPQPPQLQFTSYDPFLVLSSISYTSSTVRMAQTSFVDYRQSYSFRKGLCDDNTVQYNQYKDPNLSLLVRRMNDNIVSINGLDVVGRISDTYTLEDTNFLYNVMNFSNSMRPDMPIVRFDQWDQLNTTLMLRNHLLKAIRLFNTAPKLNASALKLFLLYCHGLITMLDRSPKLRPNYEPVADESYVDPVGISVLMLGTIEEDVLEYVLRPMRVPCTGIGIHAVSPNIVCDVNDLQSGSFGMVISDIDQASCANEAAFVDLVIAIATKFNCPTYIKVQYRSRLLFTRLATLKVSYYCAKLGASPYGSEYFLVLREGALGGPAQFLRFEPRESFDPMWTGVQSLTYRMPNTHQEFLNARTSWPIVVSGYAALSNKVFEDLTLIAQRTHIQKKYGDMARYSSLLTKDDVFRVSNFGIGGRPLNQLDLPSEGGEMFQEISRMKLGNAFDALIAVDVLEYLRRKQATLTENQKMIIVEFGAVDPGDLGYPIQQGRNQTYYRCINSVNLGPHAVVQLLNDARQPLTYNLGIPAAQNFDLIRAAAVASIPVQETPPLVLYVLRNYIYTEIKTVRTRGRVISDILQLPDNYNLYMNWFGAAANLYPRFRNHNWTCIKRDDDTEANTSKLHHHSQPNNNMISTIMGTAPFIPNGGSAMNRMLQRGETCTGPSMIEAGLLVQLVQKHVI